MIPAPATADICSHCDRVSDDLIDRAHGDRICGRCRNAERARYEAETGECWHGCGYDLAWHPKKRTAATPCPTEDEARRRSGTA